VDYESEKSNYLAPFFCLVNGNCGFLRVFSFLETYVRFRSFLFQLQAKKGSKNLTLIASLYRGPNWYATPANESIYVGTFFLEKKSTNFHFRLAACLE